MSIKKKNSKPFLSAKLNSKPNLIFYQQNLIQNQTSYLQEETEYKNAISQQE